MGRVAELVIGGVPVGRDASMAHEGLVEELPTRPPPP